MKKQPLSRREFCSDLAKGTIAAALVSPILGITVSAKWQPMNTIMLDLSKPEYEKLKETNGAIKIPNPHDKKRPIIVIRVSETEVAAMSSKCTHFGCEVGLPIDNKITCPCHKASFDIYGKVTKGPAKKALLQFDAAIDGATIVIKDKPLTK